MYCEKKQQSINVPTSGVNNYLLVVKDNISLLEQKEYWLNLHPTVVLVRRLFVPEEEITTLSKRIALASFYGVYKMILFYSIIQTDIH